MAVSRSSFKPQLMKTQPRFEKILFPRDWVVVGHVIPQIRGESTYQTVVHARSATAAENTVIAACASSGIAFYKHSIVPMGNRGGFSRPRNAMGQV